MQLNKGYDPAFLAEINNLPDNSWFPVDFGAIPQVCLSKRGPFYIF